MSVAGLKEKISGPSWIVSVSILILCEGGFDSHKINRDSESSGKPEDDGKGDQVSHCDCSTAAREFGVT